MVKLLYLKLTLNTEKIKHPQTLLLFHIWGYILISLIFSERCCKTHYYSNISAPFHLDGAQIQLTPLFEQMYPYNTIVDFYPLKWKFTFMKHVQHCLVFNKQGMHGCGAAKMEGRAAGIFSVEKFLSVKRKMPTSIRIKHCCCGCHFKD